jgi:hypothetical protein
VRPASRQTNRSDGANQQTARSDGANNQPDRSDGPTGWSALPTRLRYALGIALAGGALLAVGPLLPVVSPAMPPGFAAGPLMFVLGLLPVGVALVLAGRGSVAAARGALLAAALFAPGRAIADAQLAIQGSVAARPELLMPTALLKLHGATGLWLLLAGEALVLAGGLLAIGTSDTDPAPSDSDRPSSRTIATDDNYSASRHPSRAAGQVTAISDSDRAPGESGRTSGHVIAIGDTDPMAADSDRASGRPIATDDNSAPPDPSRASGHAVATGNSDSAAGDSGWSSDRTTAMGDTDSAAGDADRATGRMIATGDTHSASRDSGRASGHAVAIGNSDSAAGDSGWSSDRAIAMGDSDPMAADSDRASVRPSATGDTYSASLDSGQASNQVVPTGDSDSASRDSGRPSSHEIGTDSDSVAGESGRASSRAVGGTYPASRDSGRVSSRVIGTGDSETVAGKSSRASGRASTARDTDPAAGDSGRASGRMIASGDTDQAADKSARASGRAIGGGNSASRESSRPPGRASATDQTDPMTGDPRRAFGRAIGTSDSGSSVSESRTSSRYQGPVLIALGLGVVVALGLMAVPFTSSTPFVLANGVLDAPFMALAGGLLIAVAAPLAATIAVTSADPIAARGWLLGGQAVVLAIALPRVVSGLAVHGLHPSWGPYVAVVAALVLVAIGLYTERVIRPAPEDDAEPAELRLPGQSRLHVATGVLGLVAAGAALVGADTNLYVLSADLPHNTDVAGRLLVPAAVLIGVCAIGMLIPRWAAMVRPAFAVAWVSVLLAGFGAVDTAMTATQIDGVRLGIGTWATGLAMLAALAAACTAGLAGGVERDDVDLTELSWRPQVLAPAVVAAVLAIGAFGLPVLQADGFTPPGIWSDFRFASWGLVFGLVAVVAAALLAPICRPARAVGLLLGAAGLVLVRLLSLPLDRSTVPGTGAGPGMPLAVACLLALLVAAGMAGWLARREAVQRAAARRVAVKPVRARARRR